MTRQQIDFMNERAIVVCGEGWNPGVIGLAASRLVEKDKWPTSLLSRDGDICVGSARSIPCLLYTSRFTAVFVTHKLLDIFADMGIKNQKLYV